MLSETTQNHENHLCCAVIYRIFTLMSVRMFDTCKNLCPSVRSNASEFYHTINWHIGNCFLSCYVTLLITSCSWEHRLVVGLRQGGTLACVQLSGWKNPHYHHHTHYHANSVEASICRLAQGMRPTSSIFRPTAGTYHDATCSVQRFLRLWNETSRVCRLLASPASVLPPGSVSITTKFGGARDRLTMAADFRTVSLLTLRVTGVPFRNIDIHGLLRG